MIKREKNLKTRLVDFAKTTYHDNHNQNQLQNQLQDQQQNQQQEKHHELFHEYYEKQEKLAREKKRINEKKEEGKFTFKKGIKKKIGAAQSLAHSAGDEKDAIQSLFITKEFLSGSFKIAEGMFKLLNTSVDLIKYLKEKHQTQKEYLQNVKKTSAETIENKANRTHNILHNPNPTPKQSEKQSETETVVKQPKISLKKTKTKNPSLKR